MDLTIQHATMAKVCKFAKLRNFLPPDIAAYTILFSSILCNGFFMPIIIIFKITADVPFGQVKLGELGAWFGRRNKSPSAIAGAVSRAWWRWQHKYVFPKRAGIAPFFQLTVASMAFFYIINYPKMKHHRNYKYH